MHRKTCNRTEENHDLADMGSLSPIQNVTAAMLLEAPNEVKKKNQSLVFRTNPYGFTVEEALVQERTETSNYPEGKKASESLLCSALDACESLRDLWSFIVRGI